MAHTPTISAYTFPRTHRITSNRCFQRLAKLSRFRLGRDCALAPRLRRRNAQPILLATLTTIYLCVSLALLMLYLVDIEIVRKFITTEFVLTALWCVSWLYVRSSPLLCRQKKTDTTEFYQHSTRATTTPQSSSARPHAHTARRVDRDIALRCCVGGHHSHTLAQMEKLLHAGAFDYRRSRI